MYATVSHIVLVLLMVDTFQLCLPNNVLQIASTGRDGASTGRDGISSSCRELSMIMVDSLMYTCMLDDQVDESISRVKIIALMSRDAQSY